MACAVDHGRDHNGQLDRVVGGNQPGPADRFVPLKKDPQHGAIARVHREQRENEERVLVRGESVPQHRDDQHGCDAREQCGGRQHQQAQKPDGTQQLLGQQQPIILQPTQGRKDDAGGDRGENAGTDECQRPTGGVEADIAGPVDHAPGNEDIDVLRQEQQSDSTPHPRSITEQRPGLLWHKLQTRPKRIDEPQQDRADHRARDLPRDQHTGSIAPHRHQRRNTSRRHDLGDRWNGTRPKIPISQQEEPVNRTDGAKHIGDGEHPQDPLDTRVAVEQCDGMRQELNHDGDEPRGQHIDRPRRIGCGRVERPLVNQGRPRAEAPEVIKELVGRIRQIVDPGRARTEIPTQGDGEDRAQRLGHGQRSQHPEGACALRQTKRGTGNLPAAAGGRRYRR